MQTILLIGTGPMAIEYSKVLLAMNKKFIVVGRGSESASLFEQKTGIIPELGGLDLYLKEEMSFLLHRFHVFTASEAQKNIWK